MKIYIWTISLCALAVLLGALIKSKCFGGLFQTAMGSCLVMAVMWFCGILGIFKIGINAFTIVFALFFGVPGLVTLLFFNVLTLL